MSGPPVGRCALTGVRMRRWLPCGHDGGCSSTRRAAAMDGRDYEEIAYEVGDDGVAVLTLDRPDKLNAFTPTMLFELIDAFDRIDADDAVRVVIITGRGRAFCAGADLGAGGAAFDADAAGPRRRAAGRPPGRWRPVDLAHLPEPQAGHRRHQRPRGRHRHHHDPGHGHPPGRRRRPPRVRLRPAGHRARGGLVVVPAPVGRHQQGAGVGLPGRRLRRGRGAGSRADPQPARPRRPAAARRGSWPRPSPPTRRPCRWR